MSDFFTLPDPPPEPEPDEFVRPEWMGPPDNVLPAPVQASLVLGRSPDAVVYLHTILAYPVGLSFSMAIRTRSELGHFDPFEPLAFTPRHALRGGSSGIPDAVLRFGVQFPDGSKATNLDPPPFPPDPKHADPDGPILMPGGGGGGMTSWDVSYWLWPVPPPGMLTFVCEWPARNIALTESTLNTDPCRAAAAKAEVLWPATREGGAGGFFTYGG